MSPSSRQKAYARRRYEAYQKRVAKKQATRRRWRRALLAAGGAAAAVALVVGAVLHFTRGSDSTPAAAATPTPDAATASADPDNPCATPPAAPTEPMQFDAAPAESAAKGKTFEVTLDTSCGPLTLRLDGAEAPKAVSSFVFLAEKGYFDDTPCHRLTTEGIYVLQCGDPTGSGIGDPGYKYGPIENAPADDVYPAGTIAMARQGDNGDSMGSQFFLVYKDSTIPSDSAGGYTVLGEVTDGLDVVDTVAEGGVVGGGPDGAPARAVSITSTSVSDG